MELTSKLKNVTNGKLIRIWYGMVLKMFDNMNIYI